MQNVSSLYTVYFYTNQTYFEDRYRYFEDEEFILSDDEYELDEANTESLQVEPTEVEEKVKGLNISHWYSFTASMHGLWFQVQNYLNTKYTQIQTHKSSCGPDMSAM